MAGMMAVWNQSELAALLAALGGNLAASILIVPEVRSRFLGTGWIEFVQVNIAASSAAAIVWLATRRLIYRPATGVIPYSPLLTCQVLLGFLGNALLLIGAALSLVQIPEVLDETTRQAASPLGWSVFCLALLPPAWYLGTILSAAKWRVDGPYARAIVHIVGILALGIGVQGACTAAVFSGSYWVAYRFLIGACGLAGVALLAGGCWWCWRRARSNPDPALLTTVQMWSVGFAAVVLVLVLRGAAFDPAGPLRFAGFVLFPAIIFVGLAALRDEEIWPFAAGLCLNLAMSLAVWHANLHRILSDWRIYLAEFNLIVAAIVALVWHRTWRIGVQRVAIEPLHPPLLLMQVLIIAAGNLTLLGIAAMAIVQSPANPFHLVGGAGLGVFFSFLLGVRVLWSYFQWSRDSESVLIEWYSPLGLPVASACLMEVLPGRGAWLSYHILLVGWSLCGVLFLSRTVFDAAKGRPKKARGTGINQLYTAAFGVLTLFIAIRAVLLDPDQLLWGTAALGIVAATSALFALVLRRDYWVFIAGCYCNIAISLLLWHNYVHEDFGQWRMALLQGNVITSSVIAFAWLACARSLYPTATNAVRHAPLLTLQVALGLLGNAALLTAPAYWLIVTPQDLPFVVKEAGTVGGWVALLLALAAAVWFTGRDPRVRVSLWCAALRSPSAFLPRVQPRGYSPMTGCRITCFAFAGSVRARRSWALAGRRVMRRESILYQRG